MCDLEGRSRSHSVALCQWSGFGEEVSITIFNLYGPTLQNSDELRLYTWFRRVYGHRLLGGHQAFDPEKFVSLRTFF